MNYNTVVRAGVEGVFMSGSKLIPNLKTTRSLSP